MEEEIKAVENTDGSKSQDFEKGEFSYFRVQSY